ncbi:MAG: hypothetical protein M1819_003575 [Sarea resinae]|nr:MAG: hypothetical protein M1819_003575 [Sarea resinae]
MDINSLLSPDESPINHNSATPPAVQNNNNPVPAKPRRTTTSSSLASQVTSSSHHQSTAAPPVLPHNAVAQAQQIMPSPPVLSPNNGRIQSTTSTPPADARNLVRQPSTPGMDTLAELASMQHHQQTARSNASGLRSAEVFDSQLSPSTMYPGLHTNSRTRANARSPRELAMTDVPAETPPPRKFVAKSLSKTDLETVAQLFAYLSDNPYAYEYHVQLINLLHQGFVSHLYPSSSPDTPGDPREYGLLGDLRAARETMESKFPVGEDLWANWIEDESILANSIEDRIAVMELCQRAVEEEMNSTKLWLLYGNWVTSLYKAAHHKSDDDELMEDAVAGASWSEEDRMVGREVFTWQTALDVWQQGTRATEWRMNDSHLIWNRYTEMLVDEIADAATPDKVGTLEAHFLARLQTPHSAWDETFQAFSTFVSTHDSAAYEDIMVTTKKRAADGREQYALRETFEVQLERAAAAGDRDAEWLTFSEYLEWEQKQKNVKTVGFSPKLCGALYERALLRFPTDAGFWEDYVGFILDQSYNGGSSQIAPLTMTERATRHCPWSGALWSQYIFTCEREGRSFQEIEDIKHKATSRGLLDIGTMEEVLQVYSAWCSFLRRRAFLQDATDEDLDVAEVGLRSALETARNIGEKKHGQDYEGDPAYRLERIYIKFLCQSKSWDSAREFWQSLVPARGDSWEFWHRYYMWEMITWGKMSSAFATTNERKLPNPSYATAVLRQGLGRKNIDWPEKMIESYIHHCQQHEEVEELQEAMIVSRNATKEVLKRRQRETAEAAEAALKNEPQPEAPHGTVENLASGKRKREKTSETAEGSASKRTRADDTPDDPQVEQQPASAASPVKRDRENTTAIVRNLPGDATELRVRQFFRDCGTIHSLKLIPEDNGNSATATIEFESKEDVLAAQTRDMKVFHGSSIEVQIGTGSTIFVTNFPPTADEAYIRELFQEYGEIIDVRFPSLKYNTHRRFCYVQFKSSSQAHAATQLHGKSLGDKQKLVVRVSDPSHKQSRTGPVYEGRELFLSNLDWDVTEDEISQIFSKFGTVEKVRLPRNISGKSKGMAFVVFSSKDEATAALELNLIKLKSRLLNVSISEPNPAKRQAATIITKTPTPEPNAPDQQQINGDVHASLSPPPTLPSSSASSRDIRSRTIALLNIPDTVNDARIRTLMEPYGPLVKIVLRPDHRGAIVEFKDVKDAGKASLSVDGHEIAPGRKIGVGSVAELMKQEAEMKPKDQLPGGGGQKKQDVIGNGDHSRGSLPLSSSMPIRRPGQPAGRRGRGGLGVKRNGIGRGGLRANEEHTDGKEAQTDAHPEIESGGKKNNADFKAMFLGN